MSSTENFTKTSLQSTPELKLVQCFFGFSAEKHRDNCAWLYRVALSWFWMQGCMKMEKLHCSGLRVLGTVLPPLQVAKGFCRLKSFKMSRRSIVLSLLYCVFHDL